MQPTKLDPQPADDLWRARLRQQIDLRHPQLGRPGVPIRLMVGLCYLQHTFQLSDQEVVEGWVENPYWQVFCGFDHLQLKLPIDPSSRSAGAGASAGTASSSCCRRRSPRRPRPRRSSSGASSGSASTPRCSPRRSPIPWTRASTTAAARSWSASPNATACRCARVTPGSAKSPPPSQPLRPRPSDEARQARDQTLEDLPRPGVARAPRKLAGRPEVAERFAEPLARVERLLANSATTRTSSTPCMRPRSPASPTAKRT